MLGILSSTSNVLKQFNWTEVGFIYTDIEPKEAEHLPFCKHYARSFKDSSVTYFANISTYTRYAKEKTVAAFENILDSMKSRARVILVCIENRDHRRNLFIAAIHNNMIGKDYVYLLIQVSAKPNGFGSIPFWEMEAKDNYAPLLKEAAKSVLIVCFIFKLDFTECFS